MSIFLLVLKILGITLLSLIGLVLLIACLILFVPVRYRAESAYVSDVDLNVRLSWLLHLVTFRYTLSKDKTEKQLRILGIPVSKRKKKEKSTKRRKKEEKPLDRVPKEDEITLEGFEDKQPSVPEPAAESQQDGVEEEKKGFYGKLKEYIAVVRDFILHFREKILHYENKIKTIISLFTDEAKKETLTDALTQVVIILKAIRPRKCTGHFRFGFAEPDTTGKILAIASILYPFIGKSFSIEPYFDREILEGDLFVRGRVFVITLLIAGWKLYFNKDLRKILDDLRSES
ncbi:MAG: hypothetical protein J5518_06940 [Lachnospiraceae bacterium]|nr:hypothetical protein [Lachnospiraceae bacterium]